MGNLRACFALAAGLAACGNDHGTVVDAPKLIDAAIDAEAIDAPSVDASLYDFSCLTNPQPTMAPDTLTYAGTADAISIAGGGLTAQAGVVLDAYLVSAPTVSIANTTSAIDGTFSVSLTTSGTPLDAFVKAVTPKNGATTYRISYVYPPNLLHASAAGVLMPVVDDATFGELASFVMATQDDSTNGSMFVQVQDCGGVAIKGATLSVQQNGADVGTQFDLGTLAAQAAGFFFVFNVPDGDTQVSATLGTTTFPTTAHTVTAYKKAGTANAEGTITITQVVPGPST